MEINKKVWSLQLLRYLVFTRGYLRVSMIFPSNAKPEDYWLVNASEEFQVIHINDDEDVIRRLNSNRNLQTYKRISELLRAQKPGKMLDISLNDQATSYSSDGIRYIRLYPGCELDEDIAKSFPQLSTVVYDVEDPQQELVNLEKDIVARSMKSRRNGGRIGPVLKEYLCKSFLIPATICIFICAAVNISAIQLNTPAVNTAIAFGAYYKAFITILNQYWRLLTSGFVHVSPLHLMCNMTSLFSLAGPMEKRYGFGRSMAILLLSVIMGNLLEFVGGPNKVCVGLSGGLYGFLGAMTVHYIRSGYFKDSYFRRSFFNTLYINVMISFLPNVSFMSHLAGFVTGGFLAVLCDSELARNLRINVAVCSLLLASAIGYVGITNNSLNEFYYQTDRDVASVYRSFGFDSLADRIVRDTYKYYSERS
ncbi:MAG: rhomboid family intramembrane serine protease [Erysipelotrichaceae bacterium]|nr:rhomboid family intramembrane serine protease [Erysipelotrichaceae bacterium]